MNQINIVKETSQNFIDSSYEINTNRAFPNVKDGLKPGQRACLWEMWHKKYLSSKPHVKSAKVSGGVIASWHPHGDQAIYETFVRMAQNFTNNVPTIDFHGACGNIILGGDSFADARYTEVRLSKIVEDGMFNGIDKNSVDMILNFSEDEKWPSILPAVFPNLLVNGTQGIGVGMANYWLPHSFTETANVISKYIDTGEVDYENYYPDFPTGGRIINKNELSKINKTGTGKVVVEASYEINGNEINFYEFPFQVYIEPLIEEIRECIEPTKPKKDGTLPEPTIFTVKECINKSDKKHTSLVIVSSSDPEITLKELFENTSLRSQYDANQNGIISKTPVLLNLEDMLRIYVEHNTNCIKREFQFDMEKAKERLHILEGLLIAVNNIDKVIYIIRNDANPSETLMKEYNLDKEQVKAILDMKLSRLSKLEIENLNNEISDKKNIINNCNNVINNYDEQKNILKSRLLDLVKKYGDKRRTKVEQKVITKSIKGSTAKEVKEKVAESVIITINTDGYAKKIPVKNYRKTKENLILSTKVMSDDMLMLFSSFGKMYRIAVSDIKQCNPTDKGQALGAMLKIDNGEKIVKASPMNSSIVCDYIYFATEKGMFKKSQLSEYDGKTRNVNGIAAMKIKDGDKLISVDFGNDDDSILFITKNGYSLRCESNSFSYQGKTAGGVKGIGLRDDDTVIKCISCNTTDPIIIVSENGKGRKIPLSSFTIQNRGGKGTKCGGEPIAAVIQSAEEDTVLVIGEKKNEIVSVSKMPISSKSNVGNYLLKDKVIDIIKK